MKTFMEFVDDILYEFDGQISVSEIKEDDLQGVGLST